MDELRCRFPQDYRISEAELKSVQSAMSEDIKFSLRVLRAVANPIRLKILKALSVRELCVCVLVSLLGIQYSKLSYHLKLLKQAGLVKSRREGIF